MDNNNLLDNQTPNSFLANLSSRLLQTRVNQHQYLSNSGDFNLNHFEGLISNNFNNFIIFKYLNLNKFHFIFFNFLIFVNILFPLFILYNIQVHQVLLI